MRGFPERNPRTTDEDFTPSGLVGRQSRLRRIVVRGNTPHEQPGEIVPVTKLGHKGPFAPSLLFPAKVTPHKQPKINARKISLADWARRRPLDVVASFPALPESTDADFCADKKSRGCSSLPLFSPRNGDRNRTTAMARMGAALRPPIRLGKSAGRYVKLKLERLKSHRPAKTTTVSAFESTCCERDPLRNTKQFRRVKRPILRFIAWLRRIATEEPVVSYLFDCEPRKKMNSWIRS